tara:strand:- start:537 stop:692 length:156 start_codon:yes stop_codon:yes gene_type:complete
MLKQITLTDFNADDHLTISEIILEKLEGLEDFNQDQFQLKWEIVVSRDTFK